MARNNKFQSTGATSGTLDGVAAGTVTPGATVPIAPVRPGSLSAKFVVDAETDTITITALWQVSLDGSTWLTCAYAANNPAAVVLATGTAGADTAVTKVVEAPAAVAGWPFARAAVTNGVAEGNAVDTYAISYQFCRN